MRLSQSSMAKLRMLKCVSLLLASSSLRSMIILSASTVDARNPWGLLKSFNNRRCSNANVNNLAVRDDCSSSDSTNNVQKFKCNREHPLLMCRGGYADYIGDGDSPWAEKEDEQQNMHPMQQQQPNRGDQMNYLSQQQQQQQPHATYGSNNPHQQPPQALWQNSNTNDSQYMQRGGPPRYASTPPQHQQQHPYSQQRNIPQRGSPPPQQQHQHSQQYQRPPYQQQQQKQQQQQLYQQPPDLPGDSSSGPHHQSNHPSRIQNAAMSLQRQAPYGFDEDDIDDDDDDMLPSRDGLIGGDEGGIALESQSSSPAAAQQQQGGMDLSQFNKDVIFSGLKRLYRKKIRPLELSSKYGHFHSPPLSPSDFDSKPMVLLLGQYSVGKTSFIRYLLGRDFPGQRIGPEPTTDRFVAILKGDSGDKIVPGAALCSQGDRPFRGLSPFGNNFLSRFEGVEMDSPILNNITLVDTPGILSGQKQSIGRNYDYEQVMKWFAERADLIIMYVPLLKLAFLSPLSHSRNDSLNHVSLTSLLLLHCYK